MRTRWTRWLTAATCAAVLGSTAAAATAGAATPRQAAPSDKYCEALQTNYAVGILIGFISAFSDIGNDSSTGERVDPDEIRGTFLLVLSPALESTARVLAKGGSKKLRKVFAAQAKVFAKGVKILEDEAGVTDKQIDALRDFKLSTDPESATDLETVFEDNDIDQDKVKELGKEFAERYSAIDIGGAGEKESVELGRLAVRCGVTADPEINCEELVTPEEATAALGVEATRDDDETCSYLGPAPDTGLQPELAVEVYGTGKAFDRITEASAETQSIDGVGDEAIAFEGFSAQGGIKTCGRTLVAQADDKTIVVALCLPDEAEVTDDVLIGLGTQVLDRLG